MKIVLQQGKILPAGDVLVLGFFAKQPVTDHPWWPSVPAPIRQTIKTWLGKPEMPTSFGAGTVLHFGSGKFKTVLVQGFGEQKVWNSRRGRMIARMLIRLALQHRWKTMVTPGTHRKGIELNSMILQHRAENYLMAEYEFRAGRSTPKGGWPEIQRLTIVYPQMKAEWKTTIRQAEIVAQAVNTTRDLANLPGSHMTPTLLANEARKIGREAKLPVTILNVAQMKKLGMGAVLGVAQGSAEAPKFIVMEYWGASHHPRTPPRAGGGTGPLVFVGKGVTFDSGGLNLKPGDAMNEMHMDMAGGAAVLAAVSAIAKLKLPINVVAIVPAVENMPSGSGYRPGDLLKSMSGKVIEVNNTDAEGRVILADGLTYAQKFFKPRMIVDVATLTGAAVVALGQKAIAMFTNRDDWEATGREIGEVSGDYVWPLPLWEEYEGEIKGNFGDVSNTGRTRYGGAINGAMFLKLFVDQKIPWVHLDIAPTMTSSDGDNLAKGASGTGVRWLAELARREAQV